VLSLDIKAVGLLRHGERFWLLIVCKKGSGPWVVVLLLVSLVSSMFSDGISISCGLSEVSVCHVEASVALATRLGVFCVLPTRNVDNDLCIVDMNWRCLSSWSFRSFFVRESWAGSHIRATDFAHGVSVLATVLHASAPILSTHLAIVFQKIS
jgi:hypothetical protein